MRAGKKFLEDSIKHLKAAIEEAEGNEVFALGFVNQDGLIEEIRIIACGNEHAVPALVHDSGRNAYLIHNHPSARLSPSDNDLAIASRWADQGLGSCIVDNAVERVYVIVEPRLVSLGGQLDPLELRKALSPGGRLAKRMGHYEARPSQLDLLEQVAGAFNRDAVLIAEAGTGTGKSFAYLLPALHWTLQNDERIVISTATINLQHQLFEKDLPFLMEALGKKVETLLVKGRSNYLCQRRLSDALSERDLFSESLEGIEELAAWAQESASGSKSDLSWLPEESLWARVCSESDTCLGMRCPSRDSCFVLKLKREAAASRILVVNHHLLFADLAARAKGAGFEQAAVLPPWDRLIIDEAHNIEDSATSFFSESFGRLGLFRQMSRLLRFRGSSISGLLPQLARSCGQSGFIYEFEEAMKALKSSIEDLDERALFCLERDQSIRLGASRYSDVDGMIFPAFTELRLHISRIASVARQLFDILEEEESDDPAIWEAKAIIRRLESAGSVCNSFLEYSERPDRILWLERRRTSRGEPWVLYCDSPLDVAPALRDNLFEACKTVVCVSATLTVDNSFDYYLKRSGASISNTRELSTGIFPSPFPYRERVMLSAIKGAPLPDSPVYQDFLAVSVLKLILASRGSALILFTSFDSLRRTWEAVKTQLEEEGLPVYRQGDDDRSRLMTRFKEEKNSVLFATDSFWEGIDAPGDTLRLVIICRLPFRSPNDPIFEARAEALEKRGGNAFMQISVPEAVMKLRQGFGRLMRSSLDHGAVVILDGRILAKRYGQTFIRSLPPSAQSFEYLDDVLDGIKPFLHMDGQ